MERRAAFLTVLLVGLTACQSDPTTTSLLWTPTPGRPFPIGESISSRIQTTLLEDLKSICDKERTGWVETDYHFSPGTFQPVAPGIFLEVTPTETLLEKEGPPVETKVLEEATNVEVGGRKMEMIPLKNAPRAVRIRMTCAF